jgi:hypothetical protein
LWSTLSEDAGCSGMMGEAGSNTASADEEMRIVRARHADLASQVDRAIPFTLSCTPRRLVQIFDGGSMPSSPDHFFLAYPIELDGAETEGGTGTPVGDASQQIVVDVLGHAPSAGDILTAYAVGGRWVGGRTGQTKRHCIARLFTL